MPTAPVAALTLIAGFAVAELTGVRALGGIVLVAGALWCAVRWRARAGTPAAAALVVVFALAFALSHVIGDALGAWPAVLLVAALTGAAVYPVADARPTRSGRARRMRV